MEHRTAAALVTFMQRVADAYPGKTVYVVWDNLNTHGDGKEQRWTRFNERNGGRFHFVRTPIHASWLNQVACWFSILQRRVIRYGDFADDLAANRVDRWRRQVPTFVRIDLDDTGRVGEAALEMLDDAGQPVAVTTKTLHERLQGATS